ncbi:hypothetical protein VTP01DRAFT_6820 [Rhizomucor pusillus]|uniref:uncharacterized protein n=1 Tax=Rhizomucor pusillus TaxID=4840 RepID=UPI0037422240
MERTPARHDRFIYSSSASTTARTIQPSVTFHIPGLAATAKLYFALINSLFCGALLHCLSLLEGLSGTLMLKKVSVMKQNEEGKVSQ